MKKTISLVISMLILSAFVYSEVKIGVINPSVIMEKTKKGAEISKRLEDFQNDKNQKMQALQEEIKKLQRDIQSPALNNDTRDKKTIELQTKQTDIKRFYEDAQSDFQRETQKELSELEKELLPLIETLGKTKGFSIIFDITRPGIVYFDEAIDITEEIVKAFDAKYTQK